MTDISETLGFDVSDAPVPVAPPEAIVPTPGGDTASELRGYELARAVADKEGRTRWEQVNKYAPNERGFQQASRDGGFLAERHPKETYRLRPIISVPFPEAPPQQREAPAAASDNDPAPEETSNG